MWADKACATKHHHTHLTRYKIVDRFHKWDIDPLLDLMMLLYYEKKMREYMDGWIIIVIIMDMSKLSVWNFFFMCFERELKLALTALKNSCWNGCKTSSSNRYMHKNIVLYLLARKGGVDQLDFHINRIINIIELYYYYNILYTYIYIFIVVFHSTEGVQCSGWIMILRYILVQMISSCFFLAFFLLHVHPTHAQSCETWKGKSGNERHQWLLMNFIF